VKLCCNQFGKWDRNEEDLNRMATAKEVRDEVSAILATRWQTREGQVVPDSENVKLANNDAVELDATVLYADLADSTELVNSYKPIFAAEIYKAYLVTACRIIRANNGTITAFDGDRVMAVFLGTTKNSDAARCALKINGAVKKIINPAIKTQYPNTSFEIQQAVGIDTSKLLVAKTGIRGSNDLVWVGRAANFAAKLSAVRRTGYSTFITEDVFNRLMDTSKLSGSNVMWDKLMWEKMGIAIYGSTWFWEL
jgi:class 3 adenylate cyclase